MNFRIEAPVRRDSIVRRGEDGAILDAVRCRPTKTFRNINGSWTEQEVSRRRQSEMRYLSFETVIEKEPEDEGSDVDDYLRWK